MADLTETNDSPGELFELLPDGLAFIDASGAFTRANRAAGEIFGLPPAALLGRCLGDFAAPGFHVDAAGAPLSLAGTTEAELQIVAADGAVRDVAYTAIPNAVSGLTALTLRDISKAKQLERRLEHSEARLRLAQTAGRMGTWEWAVGTDRVEWSAEMEQLYGIEPGSYSGALDEYIERTHPEDRDAVQHSIEVLVTTGSHDIEHRIVLPDGSIRWLHARGQTFYNDDGSAIRAIGVGIDVTERKRAEEALRFVVDASRELASSLDYEATLQRLSELAVPYMADWCAVWVVDEAGNPQQVSMTHRDPAKIAWAQELRRRYPTDPDATSGVPQVIRSGEPEFFPHLTEEMFVAAGFDPERLEIIRQVGLSSYMSVPMTSRGRVFGAISLVCAESGRRYTTEDLEVAQHLARRAAAAIENARVHAEVAHQRATFVSIFDSITAGVLQIDASGRITHVNPAGAELLGYSHDELVGRDLHETLHEHAVAGATIAREDCPIVAVPASGQPYRGETSFLRKDGTSVPIEVNSSPISVQGQVDGAVVVYQDIASRLEEQRLKDDFLAFATHELRSPLTPVTGLSRWLARQQRERPEDFDEETAGVVETLASEAERLARVVDLFLDLSRIDSGRMVLERSMVDVCAVVKEEAKGLSARFPVELELDCPDGEMMADTDKRRLHQVLTNLLENAAKYGGEHPRIAVRVRLDNGQAVIRVSDSGPGIPPEDIPHIFERFYRGASQSIQRQKGFGVGLFLTRELVRVVGGTISVESAPGAGATFTVCWPLEYPAIPL